MDLKISLITFSDYRFFGGGENFLLQLASTLTRNGHKVNLISINMNYSLNVMTYSDIIDYFKKIGGDKRYIKFLEIPTRRIRCQLILNSHSLYKLLEPSDIVYFINFADLFKSIQLLKTISRLGKKVIIGLHGAVVGYVYNGYERKYVNLASHLGKRKYHVYRLYKKYLTNIKVHAINHEQYINFRKEGFNVKLLPNGIYFDRSNLDVNNFNEDNKFNIIWIGRLSYNKGIDVFLDIMWYTCHKCAEMNANFYIFGAGTGSNPQKRSFRINKCNIIFMGFVKPKLLLKYMVKSHLYVSTSRKECLPLSAIESLVAGLPSILSDISGHIFLKKIVNDISLSNLNHKKYSDLIIRYYNMFNKSYEEYVRLRKRISNTARQFFSWDRIKKYYLDFFENVAREVDS